MSIDIGKRPTIDESHSSKSHVVAIGNGDVISPKESPNHVQNDGNNSIENEALINGDNSESNTNFVMTEKEKTDGPKKSSTPVTPKRLPIEEEDVKKKPLYHKRGGSTVSTGQGDPCNTTTTSSTSSLSHDASFYSHDSATLETVSLPLTLEKLKKDASARALSDPALRLTETLSRDNLSDEERRETTTRLLEEIVALKLEIINLKEENENLKRVRTDMDDELHQLTENLFEEAYKMVDEAKGDRVSAEKRLADATGQIEAMETKVSTLHNLLHTQSSPTIGSHNPHKHKKPSVKKMIRKITRKSHSHSRKGLVIIEQKGIENEGLLKSGELMSCDYNEFTEWLDMGLPTSPETHTYINRIHLSQIDPCLQFRNDQLSEKVKIAAEKGVILLEPLSGTSVDQEAFQNHCALTDESANPCSYRMKVEDSDDWHYISAYSRNKIVAVCDFYTFIGYIQKGIIKKEPTDMYWQIARLRAAMNLALLNLSLSDSLPTSTR